MLGRYPVRRQLGAGGFGAVYEAYDERMQRPVAIKVPRTKLVDSQQEREEFLREARSVAGLRHENVVTAYDFGEGPNAQFFIVYEFVDGMTLSDRARAGRIPHAESAEIIAQVADALHYAHQQGVIHRDIKPSNILLDQHGQPRVADFGLAVREDELRQYRGRIVGTRAYMSPEQVRGEGHRVDGRTDIYSLGVTLYQLARGQIAVCGGDRERASRADSPWRCKTAPPN
jgi:serine/threonine protein kinase